NDMSKFAGSVEALPDASPSAQRPLRRYAIMFSVPALLIAIGLYFWSTSGRTVSTDNAQVNAHVVAVAPEVTGRVTDVFVVENQHVKKGDLLLRLDQTPYRIALMQADAAVGNAQLNMAQLESTYHAKQADSAK